MNAIEATQLLTVISGLDGRTVSEEGALAWAAILEDVAYPDALEVVKWYFTTSSGLGLERVMPKTVLDGVAYLHADRVNQAFGTAYEAALAAGDDNDEAVRRGVENAARAKAANTRHDQTPRAIERPQW